MNCALSRSVRGITAKPILLRLSLPLRLRSRSGVVACAASPDGEEVEKSLNVTSGNDNVIDRDVFAKNDQVQAPLAPIIIEPLTWSTPSINRAIEIEEQASLPVGMEADHPSSDHVTLVAVAPKPESELKGRDDGQLTKRARQKMNKNKPDGSVLSQADKFDGFISYTYVLWRDWLQIEPQLAKSGDADDSSSQKLLMHLKHSVKQHFGRAFDVDDKVMLITQLYVDEHQWGKGVGTALLNHVEDLARRDGASFIYLHTNTSLKKAVSFYVAKGFKICSYMGESDFHGYWGDPGQEVIVELLKPAGRP